MVADAREVPEPDVLQYYGARLDAFDTEYTEYLADVTERSSTLEKHQQRVRTAFKLREEIQLAQRRLAEVEVQLARERLRTLRAATDRKDLELRVVECKASVQMLLALNADTSTRRTGAGGDASLGSSRGVMRTVAMQGPPPEVAAEAVDAWQALELEARAHRDFLDTYEAARLRRERERAAAVGEAEGAMERDLRELEEGRRLLAELLGSHLHLRREALATRRERAAELDVLNSKGDALHLRLTELARTPNARLIVLDAQQDALERVGRRRILEIEGRRNLGELEQRLQTVAVTGAAEIEGLASEIQTLQRRCDGHRRQRRLVLEGLRADLSLLTRKVEVLDGVAEAVSTQLVRASSLDRTARRPTSRRRRGRTSSPYKKTGPANAGQSAVPPSAVPPSAVPPAVAQRPRSSGRQARR